jgi:hypothetical protein
MAPRGTGACIGSFPEVPCVRFVRRLQCRAGREDIFKLIIGSEGLCEINEEMQLGFYILPLQKIDCQEYDVITSQDS